MTSVHAGSAPTESARGVCLAGDHVRLLPLTLEHVPDLIRIGLDPELWRWVPNRIESAADLETYVHDALIERDGGRAIPFVTWSIDAAQVVGSSRFAAIVPDHRRVEIGWTWIARPWQRTAVNTEAKLLMLGHAFGALGCQRVELKTDALNTRSRAAMERIGCQYEGMLRQHILMPTGRWRDTVYYSITADEWPTVRARLTERLQRGAEPA